MDTTLLQLDPQPYLWRLGFLWLLFTFIGVAVFLLLTGRGARITRGGGLLPNRWALAIVLPLWLLALGWRYHAEFGGRFFEVRLAGPGAYELVYAYPTRSVTIDDEEIAAWRAPVDWTEKLPGRHIEIELTDGATHRSSRLYRDEYAAVRRRFAQSGVALPARP